LLDIFAMEELLDTFGPSPVVSEWPACFVLTGDEAVARFGEPVPQEIPVSPTGVLLPGMSGTFHISGLQSILKDFETTAAIRNMVIPLYQEPDAKPYMRLHKILRSIEVRSGLQDEGLFVSEKEGEALYQANLQSQQQMAEMQLRAMEQQTQLAEQQGELEGKRLELEGQKLAMDARRMEAEAMRVQLDAERKQAELAGTLATLDAELRQREADLAQTMAEIARTDHELQRSILETMLGVQKVESQIRKIDAQVALAERKAALQERVALAQIQAQRAQTRQE